MRRPGGPLRRTDWPRLLIVLILCLAGARWCEARAADLDSVTAGVIMEADAAAADRSPHGPQPPETPDDTRPDDPIIVTARRWGQADMASETELDEDRIAAYGADTIGALVEDIAPLIGGSRDTPILLVNGRRIGSATEVTGYPPEALNRLAILPPEAAARYGYAAGQRVVNLELKKNFASTAVDGGFATPFAGGRSRSQLSAARTIIDGDTRWNIQVRGSADTPLLKSERDIPVRPDVAPILPLLEAAEGRSIDPNQFETLAAKTRSLNLNMGVVRPVGDFFLSLNANAGINRSTQRTGMPLASIVVPVGGGGRKPSIDWSATARSKAAKGRPASAHRHPCPDRLRGGRPVFRRPFRPVATATPTTRAMTATICNKGWTRAIRPLTHMASGPSCSRSPTATGRARGSLVRHSAHRDRSSSFRPAARVAVLRSTQAIAGRGFASRRRQAARYRKTASPATSWMGDGH